LIFAFRYQETLFDIEPIDSVTVRSHQNVGSDSRDTLLTFACDRIRNTVGISGIFPDIYRNIPTVQSHQNVGSESRVTLL